jgi:hypothetical protein
MAPWIPLTPSVGRSFDPATFDGLRTGVAQRWGAFERAEPELRMGPFRGAGGPTMRQLILIAIAAFGTACSPAVRTAPSPTADVIAPSHRECAACAPMPITDELSRAIEQRIDALARRGGDCARYGAVIERSFRQGQIMVRPFMWRVGTQLASGEAKPTGEMILAREVDSLNVGVRTLDDVVASVEHEAVHIAFGIRSENAGEQKAERLVAACRGDATTSQRGNSG